MQLEFGNAVVTLFTSIFHFVGDIHLPFLDNNETDDDDDDD